MDQQLTRIKILEFMGWRDLDRDSKFNHQVALRGIDPKDGQRKIAPNPLTNLNYAREVYLRLPVPWRIFIKRELTNTIPSAEELSSLILLAIE